MFNTKKCFSVSGCNHYKHCTNSTTSETKNQSAKRSKKIEGLYHQKTVLHYTRSYCIHAERRIRYINSSFLNLSASTGCSILIIISSSFRVSFWQWYHLQNFMVFRCEVIGKICGEEFLWDLIIIKIPW